MQECIKKLRSQITIGVVGGSDLVKQKEQLGENGNNIYCIYIIY
jgi:phosphomannomutase